MSIAALAAEPAAVAAPATSEKSWTRFLTERKSVVRMAAPYSLRPRTSSPRLQWCRHPVASRAGAAGKFRVNFLESEPWPNRSVVMKGDAKVVEFLNKALRHELTAVNQYWLHYRLLDNWGYKDLAKQWRKESIEEMEHADKLVVRIIFLEGFPNLQLLDPL